MESPRLGSLYNEVSNVGYTQVKKALKIIRIPLDLPHMQLLTVMTTISSGERKWYRHIADLEGVSVF